MKSLIITRSSCYRLCAQFLITLQEICRLLAEEFGVCAQRGECLFCWLSILLPFFLEGLSPPGASGAGILQWDMSLGWWAEHPEIDSPPPRGFPWEGTQGPEVSERSPSWGRVLHLVQLGVLGMTPE